MSIYKKRCLTIPVINPTYRQFKIPAIRDVNVFELKHPLSQLWHQYNRSGFTNNDCRARLVAKATSLSNPYEAHVVLSDIKTIHHLTDFSQEFGRRKIESICRSSWGYSSEIAIHRKACQSVYEARLIFSSLFFGFPPAELEDLQEALYSKSYSPNPAWLENIHEVSCQLIIDIIRTLLKAHPQAGNDKQKVIEGLLSAAAVIASQDTFDAVSAIIIGLSTDLSQQIIENRDTFSNGRFAYHFTREAFMPSIAKKGLSAMFAPEDSEQPEYLCFNNEDRAGIHAGILGLTSYYINDYLLRVKTGLPIRVGQHAIDEQMGDLSADFILAKDDIIPPSQIEIVNPFSPLQAIPLIIG